MLLDDDQHQVASISQRLNLFDYVCVQYPEGVRHGREGFVGQAHPAVLVVVAGHAR